MKFAVQHIRHFSACLGTKTHNSKTRKSLDTEILIFLLSWLKFYGRHILRLIFKNCQFLRLADKLLAV